MKNNDKMNMLWVDWKSVVSVYITYIGAILNQNCLGFVELVLV